MPAAEGERPPQGKEARVPAPSPPPPAPHQPSTGALSSSETPKDMAPMKSFREVRSQSHTSTLSRRSTSPGFRLLRGERGAVRGPDRRTLDAAGADKPPELGPLSSSAEGLPTPGPPEEGPSPHLGPKST